MNNEKTPVILPLVALRGLVVFPGMQLHFDVGRAKSLQAIENAMKLDRTICLAAQMNITDEEPANDKIYQVGCIARIKQIVRLHGDGARVVVEGLYRAQIVGILQKDPGFVVEALRLDDTMPTRFSYPKQEAVVRVIKEAFHDYCELNRKLPSDIVLSVAGERNVSRLCDFIAGNIAFSVENKQEILKEANVAKRAEKLARLLQNELKLLGIEREIHQKVQAQMDQNQRDYYLREQLKIISEELGDDDNPSEEADLYRQKIEKISASDEIKEKLYKETNRLFKMPSGSHEATVVRGYLDAVLELPWGEKTKDKTDVKKAKKILDNDHYGLVKVKERILELLAVRTIAPDIKGQIVCLVGPPGVGKTSIVKSIANCMGRKYVRISLGGVRDEAEIRGHRRTYIGAMPGRIMEAVKQSKVQNPLILMDEIDKLGSDFRGDPSSALLEALDPEQNVAFHDHFLEIPYDLSDVLFVLTANSLDTIPPALRDRMEIIELTGYTREEKFNIAKKHLLPKQMQRHSLTKNVCSITDSALYGLIDFYTREAGVRTLEREIASLCRKSAKEIVSGAEKVKINADSLQKYLGVHKFKPETILSHDEIGLVNGLAWTSVGGEILQIETAVFPGSGKIILTGSLGDVMKESAQSAISYIRSKTDYFNIDRDFYKNLDIHVNATEGAVPKDGPSAGTAMTVSIISALTKMPIKRTVAMTGEITLLGRVLAIGGLKEKTMAAYKSGVKTVLIPEQNIPDISEIDDVVKNALEIIPVNRVEDIFPYVFADDGYIRCNDKASASDKSSVIPPKNIDRNSNVSSYS